MSNSASNGCWHNSKALCAKVKDMLKVDIVGKVEISDLDSIRFHWYRDDLADIINQEFLTKFELNELASVATFKATIYIEVTDLYSTQFKRHDLSDKEIISEAEFVLEKFFNKALHKFEWPLHLVRDSIEIVSVDETIANINHAIAMLHLAYQDDQGDKVWEQIGAIKDKLQELIEIVY